MADVEVTYENTLIKSLSASGQAVLHTAGKYCDDDITIDYTQPQTGEVEIISGGSTNTVFSGRIVGISKLKVTAGAASHLITKCNLYGANFVDNPVEITYSGFANQNATLTDFYRSVSWIKKVDFGGVNLPTTLSRFFYIPSNCADHTMIIKGLNWSNVTSPGIIFHTTTAYTAYKGNNFYIDVEWNGTINCNLNFCYSSTTYVPITHSSLVGLLNALSNNGGTITIGQGNIDSLTADEIAIATGKGWTLA